MRLLKLNDDGSFDLETFSAATLPPYAILSHTWGSDNEEATFKNLVDGTGSNKAGYQKLRFCGSQAKDDGLHYFWVDTCCIDKSNNNELTKAINSMFRWYQNAARCYVYLSDVSVRTQDSQVLHVEWESSFRNSRWFTRGWTLQELLAPKTVEFYSRDHVRLGDKTSLERQICEITGIAFEALRGRPLQDFSVKERLQWGEKRQTTEEEDKAYCLLGIFDVFLPLIYGEGRRNAMRRLQTEIKESENIESQSLQKNKTPRIMPFERNLCFTGRESELSKLEELLFQDGQTTKVAIVGLGGVGKTQLAIELVYRSIEKHRGCSVFWVPATDPESLLQAYLTVAQKLDIPGRDEQGVDVKRLVQNCLSDESAGRWLLVFDNADDRDMWMSKPVSEPESDRLLDYLPKSAKGNIVFTTRDRKVAVKLAPKNVVEVREMNPEAAAALLQKCLIRHDLAGNGSSDTEDLLAKLTYLPLAIIQASAYINANGISVADYLTLLTEQDESTIELLSEDFEDDDRYYNIKNPVATTWLISFERIQKHDPLAADYLSFMACIEPKDIQQTLLPAGPSRKKEMDAIGTLDAYSFITKRAVDRAFDLHRLVHLATRKWLTEKDLISEWTTRTIRRLAEVFPNDDHKNRAIWRVYLPHARYALLSDAINKMGDDRTELAWNFGLCLLSDGRYNEAEKALLEVVRRNKTVLGEEHPSTLTSMADLASTYWNQGRWTQAEELEVQVMETSLKVLGPEHPDTLTSMANLASTYQNQGRWTQAEELKVQVMKTSLRVLGAEHPDTLTYMANLALTYWNQGRWTQAEELEVQVIETRKRMLGTEHPDTLTSMANLASTYRKQGRWTQAEELFVQVMETRKRVLGAEHPSTLTCMINLASTYQDQGRLTQAEELEVQVMKTSLRVLGPEHPDTLTSMANLASTYQDQGRWKEAEDLQAQELEICSRVLGEKHPDTLISMQNLSLIWKGNGRDTEALQLLQKCVRLRKQVLGDDHPYTLSSSATVIEWETENLEISS